MKSPGENSDKNKGDEEETTPSTLEIKRLRELLGDVEQEMSATLKIKKLRALYGSSTDPSNFLSEATKPSCKELETFEDFHITVEGICIDSNLSEETQKKYYQLCCSQNSLLHDRLTTGINNYFRGEYSSDIKEMIFIRRWGLLKNYLYHNPL